ncbi:hypothetical protein LDENG_00032440 [Lucifuga dentata]|nr:hypothetical protein LDENG_00032440 [Lucifuga dentata]
MDHQVTYKEDSGLTSSSKEEILSTISLMTGLLLPGGNHRTSCCTGKKMSQPVLTGETIVGGFILTSRAVCSS